MLNWGINKGASFNWLAPDLDGESVAVGDLGEIHYLVCSRREPNAGQLRESIAQESSGKEDSHRVTKEWVPARAEKRGGACASRA